MKQYAMARDTLARLRWGGSRSPAAAFNRSSHAKDFDPYFQARGRRRGVPGIFSGIFIASLRAIRARAGQTPRRRAQIARARPRRARRPATTARVFDRFLADLKQQAVAAGVSQRAIARGLAVSRLRPGHRQPRPRPARVRPDLHRVRRPHGGTVPDAAGPGRTSRPMPRRSRAPKRNMACRRR